MSSKVYYYRETRSTVISMKFCQKFWSNWWNLSKATFYYVSKLKHERELCWSNNCVEYLGSVFLFFAFSLNTWESLWISREIWLTFISNDVDFAMNMK